MCVCVRFFTHVACHLLRASLLPWCSDSLGAELDDSARHEAVGRVQQQSQEIESLKRQMATLTMNKDREIDRLHGEIETLQNHGKNATRTPLGSGPSSDGEDPSKALCCCTIM